MDTKKKKRRIYKKLTYTYTTVSVTLAENLSSPQQTDRRHLVYSGSSKLHSSCDVLEYSFEVLILYLGIFCFCLPHFKEKYRTSLCFFFSSFLIPFVLLPSLLFFLTYFCLSLFFLGDFPHFSALFGLSGTPLLCAPPHTV